MGRCYEPICCIDRQYGRGCGRIICFWALVGILIASAAVIVAIVMFAISADDPRGHKISKYNSAINNWEKSGFQTFQSLSLDIGVIDNSSFVHFLTADTSPDPINDHDKKIDQYSDYLRYTNTSDNFLTQPRQEHENINLINQKTGETQQVKVTTYNTYSLYASQLHCSYVCSLKGDTCYNYFECADNCDDMNGDWHTLTLSCYFVQYLKEVCIKVSQNGSFIEKDPLCYGEIYGDNYPDTGDYSKVEQNLTVVIRSEDDPFISLYSETKGDLKFGLSSTAWLAIGIAFISFGGVLIILLAVLFVSVQRSGNCMYGKFH